MFKTKLDMWQACGSNVDGVMDSNESSGCDKASETKEEKIHI